MLEGGGHACRREGEGHASPCLLDLEISISTCLLAYFAAAQLFEEMWLNPSASAPPFPLPPSPSLAKSVAGAYSVVLSCVGFLCGLTAKSGKGLGHSSLLRRLLWVAGDWQPQTPPPPPTTTTTCHTDAIALKGRCFPLLTSGRKNEHRKYTDRSWLPAAHSRNQNQRNVWSERDVTFLNK